MANLLSAVPRGMAMMMGAVVAFAILILFVREATADLHPFVVVFWRNVFGLAFLLPWLIHEGGLGEFKTRRQGLLLGRALLGLTAMLSWFTALSVIPLAEAVALSFTAPLFATVAAALVLREVVRLRRWSATLAGFAGVLIILRPGAAAIDPVAFLVLVSALSMACSTIIIKFLSRELASRTIVAYLAFYLIPLSALPALFVWEWPDARGWLMLIGTGAVGTAGHVAFAAALKAADTSAVVPLDYLRLPLIALAGYVLYGEVMDLWSWVGAGVIIASALYIARREAVLGRQRPADPAGGPAAPG